MSRRVRHGADGHSEFDTHDDDSFEEDEMNERRGTHDDDDNDSDDSNDGHGHDHGDEYTDANDSDGRPPAKLPKRDANEKGKQQQVDSARRFSCSFCGRSYARREHLSRHIRSHKSRKSWYTCAKCNRQFYRRDHLNYHLTSHELLRIYVCAHEGCGDVFKEKADLTVHQKHRHHFGLEYGQVDREGNVFMDTQDPGMTTNHKFTTLKAVPQSILESIPMPTPYRKAQAAKQASSDMPQQQQMLPFQAAAYSPFSPMQLASSMMQLQNQQQFPPLQYPQPQQPQLLSQQEQQQQQQQQQQQMNPSASNSLYSLGLPMNMSVPSSNMPGQSVFGMLPYTMQMQLQLARQLQQQPSFILEANGNKANAGQQPTGGLSSSWQSPSQQPASALYARQQSVNPYLQAAQASSLSLEAINSLMNSNLYPQQRLGSSLDVSNMLLEQYQRQRLLNQAQAQAQAQAQTQTPTMLGQQQPSDTSPVSADTLMRQDQISYGSQQRSYGQQQQLQQQVPQQPQPQTQRQLREVEHATATTTPSQPANEKQGLPQEKPGASIDLQRAKRGMHRSTSKASSKNVSERDALSTSASPPGTTVARSSKSRPRQQPASADNHQAVATSKRKTARKTAPVSSSRTNISKSTALTSLAHEASAHSALSSMSSATSSPAVAHTKSNLSASLPSGQVTASKGPAVPTPSSSARQQQQPETLATSTAGPRAINQTPRRQMTTNLPAAYLPQASPFSLALVPGQANLGALPQLHFPLQEGRRFAAPSGPVFVPPVVGTPLPPFAPVSAANPPTREEPNKLPTADTVESLTGSSALRS